MIQFINFCSDKPDLFNVVFFYLASQQTEETGILTSSVAICLAFVIILLMLIVSVVWKRSMNRCKYLLLFIYL